MADGKLDLPDDLISSSSSKVAAEHPPWIPKVEADDDKLFSDDSKGDQSAPPDSSIPLSPQWLYSKPSDPKFPSDSDKKFDKRRSSPLDTSSDGARRWREEERETTLLSSARRDRRKPDRRPDNPSSVRESLETRPLPPSERWADTTNRNAALEPRRENSKWSTRWGPDDKDRESRSDKRTDLLDKDDLQNDNQTPTLNNSNNNRAPADRDSDARDKWRPRHRMEVNSTGPSSYRAAPGFGPDKGLVKGPTMGFTVGRGKATYGGGRGSSIGAVQFDKNETVPGKPNSSTATFRYPRGKLLDIYRKHKFDSSFTSMPDYLEDVPSIAQVDVLEPLAFVVPGEEEEVILKDIGKGKITSSDVAQNSLRKVQYESIADTDNFEPSNGANNNPPSMISRDSIDAVGGVANDDDAYRLDDDTYRLDDGARTISIGRSSKHEEGVSLETDKLSLKLPTDMISSSTEIGGSRYTSGPMSVDENGQLAGYDVTKHPQFDEGTPDALIDRSTKLPNDSDSQLLPTEQYARSNLQMLEFNGDVNRQELDIPFEELSLYYRDPQGEIQGPFLWDDIISWLDQRFFGTDLPVRFADAPDGTPFQSLGHVISCLKVRGDGFSSGMDPSSMPDEFRVLGAQSDSSLSASGPLPGVTDSSMLSYPCLPLSTGFDSGHAQSRISENEGPQQLPRSEGQSFHDSTLDEEIVFPGRPGSAGYQIGNYSRSNKDPLSNSISHHSRINEFSEPLMPNLNDGDMHPFGLLRSELEGAHPGHAQSSNISLRRTFGPTADETRVTDTWPEVYKENTVSKPGMHQDALGARHVSLLEQESTHFDMAEQLMSQQVQQQLMQQQLQQRNLLTSHLHLNESFADQLPSRNHGSHQQLPNHQVQDIEHLYMLHLQEQRQQQLQEQRQLQLQEQRQLQLQEQRQLQLQQQQLQQQQQFHQQKLILQEQQQSQARQVLLEQLLHNQMHETILGQTRGDPSRTNKVLDQMLSNQHLLHEMQQRPHHPPRHGDSSLDQLIQAKFGSPQHQHDLYELMSRAQHGQIRSLEQQIRQQEQLQARQLPMGLRQRMDMEEERNIGAAWPIGGEANQFSRTNPAAHHLAGNPLDLYQLQQRIAHEEQLTHLERNLSLQDRIQLERSMSLPPGANRDAVHAFAHAQILDRQDSNAHMHSASQMNTGFHSHHSPPLPNQYNASHLDTTDGQWPDNNGRISNDWMDSHIQQSQLNSERQKREAHGKMVSEDPSLWMSESINDEKSKRLLMDLLHQKPGHQSTDVLNANSGMAYERRNQSFSSLPDQEVGLNHFYPAGSSGFNLGAQPHTCISNEQTLQHNEMLQKSNSGVAIQEEPLINQMTSSSTSKFNKSSMEREITEPDGKKYGFKSDAKPKGPFVDVQERMAEQQRFAAVDHREISSNSNSKIASRGLSGIFNENGANTDLVAGDIGKDRVPSLLSRGQDNILLRRPPAHRASASQEGLSELTSDLTMRGKVVSNAGPPDGSVANHSSDGQKDTRFRRSSSYNDADVAETTSFMDKLKSTSKKSGPAAASALESSPSETAEGAHGGKSGKKKGKKGRQIDPALLGFKVTSNRIMMGEIQRLDD